ncbi:MAG: thermonuclease family protein [Candidatus Pacebacteria bacterium]|nr:thermonuclease family protein [Candidatus Paceibacterota bacterium]
MKKLFTVLAAFIFLAIPAHASEIVEGAVIKTANNPDVYIVKYNSGKSYKRLVLNPQVFESYGHLRWEDILTVDQETLNKFTTSDLVRVDGTSEIYQLTPNGDTGSKVPIDNPTEVDLNSIYTINHTDFGNYLNPSNAELSGPYEIYQVIDGDTFSVTINGIIQTVRLIGIDTPEVASAVTARECYGEEASTAAKEQLTGKKVYLESDAVSGDTDKYGRLLRYAYLENNTLFNKWMIEEGNAKEYTYAGQIYRYQTEFKTAQASAKTAQKGLWGIEICALSDVSSEKDAYICSADTYNCSDFATQTEAQNAYAYCLNQTGTDIHRLDSDDDGVVCEGLEQNI